MPRDLLLYLLAGVVLLNVALVLGVAIVRLTEAREPRAGSPPVPREPAARPVTRLHPRHTVARPSGPLPTAIRGPITRTAWDPAPSGRAASVRAASVPAPSVPPAAILGPPREPPAPMAPERPAAPAVRPESRHATRSMAGPAPGSTRGSSPGSAPRPAPASMRRPRRFVLPNLEEDGARAERAIEAVIGSTTEAADEAAAHRPRRRSRRHRSPGVAPHTSVDLSLLGLDELRVVAGQDAAGRLVHALATTVHAHLRSADRTIDLGDGRFRLVVEADAAGAEAATERIRSLTGAWLAAAVVPLSLRATIAAAEPAQPADVAAS